MFLHGSSNRIKQFGCKSTWICEADHRDAPSSGGGIARHRRNVQSYDADNQADGAAILVAYINTNHRNNYASEMGLSEYTSSTYKYEGEHL